MEVVINVDTNRAVQLAEYLASTIVKDYKVYVAIKEVLYRLRFSKGLSAEQEDKIRDIHNTFDKNQQKYFLWGNR